MCTLVVLRRPDHPWPLLLAANRDEMIGRAWKAPDHHWPDRQETVGGIDIETSGSWLAANKHGVVAGILNRFGTLGPLPGRRSRGELVLEAVDHADAAVAAAALAEIEPRSYRPFNLIIADDRDAFWLRHADPSGTLPVTVQPLPVGLTMITAGDLGDPDSPRIRDYLPRFRAAMPPDPERGVWRDWEDLLADTAGNPAAGPTGAMNFATPSGFATLASAIIALPRFGRPGIHPLFRFAAWRPEPAPWREIAV
jgi:hypothetical protein